MTIGFVTLPFGMRDIIVYPLTSEVVGVGVDLPNARTLSFTETETFEELRGDDALIAVHGIGPTIDWELEGGGCCFEAIKVMNSGTITETGTTPNGQKIYAKGIHDVRPYFRLEGQAISDSGGDFHVVIYRARATGEVTGKLGDSTFMVTNVKGRGLGRISDGNLYQFVQNETAVSLSTTTPTP